MSRTKLVPAEIRAAHPSAWADAWRAEAQRVGVYHVDPRRVAACVRAVLAARDAEAIADADARATEKRRAARASRRRSAVELADMRELDRSGDPEWLALRRAEIAVMDRQLGISDDDDAPTVITDGLGRTIVIRPAT